MDHRVEPGGDESGIAEERYVGKTLLYSAPHSNFQIEGFKVDMAITKAGCMLQEMLLNWVRFASDNTN
jgi:hypothetical protein